MDWFDRIDCLWPWMVMVGITVTLLPHSLDVVDRGDTMEYDFPLNWRQQTDTGPFLHYRHSLHIQIECVNTGHVVKTMVGP